MVGFLPLPRLHNGFTSLWCLPGLGKKGLAALKKAGGEGSGCTEKESKRNKGKSRDK